MKQLPLITTYELRKKFVRTDKNVLLMKKCFADCFKIDMVSKETYDKVLNTDYLRG